jgi:hypothetical protein
MPVLICPHCHKHSTSKAVEGWNSCICASCKNKFKLLLAHVRAKRLRGDKKTSSITTFVRVIYNRRENLIEYNCSYSNDLKMRSGDIVLFYCNSSGELCIVQNATLGMWTALGAEPMSLWLKIAIALVAIYVLIALLGR